MRSVSSGKLEKPRRVPGLFFLEVNGAGGWSAVNATAIAAALFEVGQKGQTTA